MKLFSYKDPSKKVTYLGTDKQVVIPKKYREVPVRGLWVSNVVNIDMPTQENLEVYKKKADEIIATCLDYNINLIYFQVRTNNDAYYKSKLNPSSRYLTGKEGAPIKFDVLEYMVKRAKENNISLHAWCNPYRVSMSGKIPKDEYLKTCHPLNIATQNDEYIILDTEGQIILNPAHPYVKAHIINSMMEIVENYDVDGIHFDDYFYPYKPVSDNHNDLAFHDGIEDIGDFRRRQVDEVIKGVYDAIKAYNPRLEFGVSPFGVWRTKTTDPRGSNTKVGAFECYDKQYADVYKWVKEGYIDYVVPQLYFEFNHPIAPFADLCDWWVSVCMNTDVKLYVGLPAYRLGREGEFENKYEVVNQIKYANNYSEVTGNIFFTYHTFIDDNEVKPGMELLKKLYKGEEV